MSSPAREKTNAHSNKTGLLEDNQLMPKFSPYKISPQFHKQKLKYQIHLFNHEDLFDGIIAHKRLSMPNIKTSILKFL